MIDIQTFMLALSIGNISFALLMVAYIHDTAPSPGLRIWTWARLVAGATQLLAFARPQFGAPALVLLEPMGWIAALALEIAAYCTFFEFRNWRRIVYPLAGLALLLACTAPLVGAGYDELMELIACVFGLCAISTACLLLHPKLKHPSLLQRMIGVNDAVFGLAIAAWALGAVTRGELGLGANISQVAAYVSGYMLMIVNGFGFLLMCKQRNDATMKRLASTDDLTGLLNRREFFARADAARMLALRQRQPIALLMLDIDHFQAAQRPLRPRHRRRGAAAVCAHHGRHPARARHPRTHGRRGVRSRPAGHRPGRRHAGGRAPAPGDDGNTPAHLRQPLHDDGQYRPGRDRTERGPADGAGARRPRPVCGQAQRAQPDRDRWGGAAGGVMGMIPSNA